PSGINLETGLGGDECFEGQLYPIPWATGKADRKVGARVNATRLIGAEFRGDGWRVSNEQALQWPRDRCPDSGLGNAECAVGSAEWRLATCELARELVVVTRTRVAPGTGVVSATTGARASFSSIRYG